MLEKEVYNSISSIKGNVRGAVFQTDAEYIKLMYGLEKLDQLKNTLKKLKSPIDYENMHAMAWYPLSQRVLAFRVIQDIFNWQDEDFKKMGDAAPKYSFIVKLIMKFFIAAKIAIERAPQYWSRHYDIGALKVAEFNEATKHAVIQVHDFDVMPIYCRYLEGYFGRLFMFTLPKHTIKVIETKCMHRGDPFHEYDIAWVAENN